MIPLDESWLRVAVSSENTQRADEIIGAFYVGYGIILPILAAIGFVGNVICFITWCHKNIRSSLGVYACALALSNSVYVATTVAHLTLLVGEYARGHGSVQDRLLSSNYLRTVLPRMEARLFPLSEICEVCITLLTVFITFDRYVLAFRPMRARVWCTITTSLKVTVTIVLVGIGVNFFSFFRFRIEHHKVNNITISKSCPSDINTDKYYQAYDRYMCYILWLIIPWCSFIIVSFIALKKMRDLKLSCEDGVSQRQIKNLHLVDALVLNLFYVILNFVRLILAFCLYFKQPVYLLCSRDYSALDIFSAWPLVDMSGTLLHVTNSCTNVFVYLISCSKFRRTLAAMLCYVKTPNARKQLSRLTGRRRRNKGLLPRLPASYERVVGDFFNAQRMLEKQSSVRNVKISSSKRKKNAIILSKKYALEDIDGNGHDGEKALEYSDNTAVNGRYWHSLSFKTDRSRKMKTNPRSKSLNLRMRRKYYASHGDDQIDNPITEIDQASHPSYNSIKKKEKVVPAHATVSTRQVRLDPSTASHQANMSKHREKKRHVLSKQTSDSAVELDTRSEYLRNPKHADLSELPLSISTLADIHSDNHSRDACSVDLKWSVTDSPACRADRMRSDSYLPADQTDGARSESFSHPWEARRVWDRSNQKRQKHHSDSAVEMKDIWHINKGFGFDRIHPYLSTRSQPNQSGASKNVEEKSIDNEPRHWSASLVKYPRFVFAANKPVDSRPRYEESTDRLQLESKANVPHEDVDDHSVEVTVV